MHAVSALERGARTRPYPHTVRSLAAALGLAGDARARLHAAVPSRGRGDAGPGGPEARVATTAAVAPAAAAEALGVPGTPLVGRRADRDAVVALVRSGARWVTLTGVGGVGKTRLAAAVAEDLAGDHPDGVVAVPLATVVAADRLLPVVARRLGLPGGDAAAARDALVTHLQSRRVLLVLDNLEQLVAAASELARLVAAAPALTVLGTSRAPMRARGEQEYPVEPLDLPDGDTGDEQRLAASPSGALVLRVARSVNPRLRLDAEDVRALSRLCHELAGLPLALELASAQLRSSRPDSSPSGTTSLAPAAARDLPERQRTMRATLDWSYGLLDPGAQRLLRLLGTFRGGATLEAVEALAGEDALARLTTLVEHSLVAVRPEPRGEPRYRMLEPVAQYARSLLVGQEAAKAARDHAAYFCTLAERAEVAYEQDGQVHWLERMAADDANVRLALDRGAASSDPVEVELAARTTWSLWLYWWLRGDVHVGRRHAEACLAAAQRAGLPATLLGRVRLACATMSYASGAGAAAAAHWEAALDCAADGHDPELEAKARAGTGLAALGAGDLPAAQERFARSLAVGPDPRGRTWMESLTRIWLGTCLLLHGDLPAARATVAHGLDLARERGDRLTQYVGLYNLTQAALAERDLVAARAHLTEGIELSAQTRDRSNLAYFFETLALVEAEERRPERVSALLGAAGALREQVGADVYAYYQPDEAAIAAAGQSARAALGPTWARFADPAAALDLDSMVALALGEA